MSKNSDDHSHFIVPVKYYVGTLIALMILTVVTVAVAQVDLAPFNVAIALGVAGLKATLVLLFFMGLKWDEAFNRVILIGSLAFFILFVAILLLDVQTRDHIYSNEGVPFDINSPVKIKPIDADNH